MGRKAGGRNFGNFTEEPQETIVITETEQSELPDSFTTIPKDFISIQDLIVNSGLSYDTCARIIREIKNVCDSFHIAGYVHRSDYAMYLSLRRKMAANGKNL